jgi:hypothetical protein
MAKGISINFGLNSVDPGHYQGWSGELRACEYDADDMAMIAASQGFSVVKMKTAQATRAKIFAAIADAAGRLAAGDICLITYSGHGGQVPDLNGDEDDAQDETWCLYDGQIVDDEIYDALSAFVPGVRVLVLSDSCHSGTMIKEMVLLSSLVGVAPPPTTMMARSREPVLGYRAMPGDVARRVYLANQAFYDPILSAAKLKDAKARVTASCLLISGCEDDQLSGDGLFNGVFTSRLKMVWNGGKFSGDIAAFWKTIHGHMPDDQKPVLFAVGDGTDAFKKLRPFKI